MGTGELDLDSNHGMRPIGR